MPWIRNINKRRKYYEETCLEAPSELLLKALPYVNGKIALDIGCGAGVDTREIARRGLIVTAVDVNEDVKNFFNEKDLRNINIIICPIQDFTFDHYDLIYAKSSLVFLSLKEFYSVIEKIKEALNQDGTLAARLWGVRDSEYATGKNYKCICVTKEQIDKIFSGWKFLYYKETERDRVDALGRMKHWHFIDIIVQKH